MPRKLRVLTTSFAFDGARTVEHNREQACAFVDAGAAERADLVCLPEYALERGVSRDHLPAVESLPGPTVDALSAQARKHSLWVIGQASLRTAAGTVENTAFVLDRRGQLAATYAKVHPTIGECERQGITPGGDATVVETDFGRVGLAICYDIGWPEHWAALARRGAELVIWPSAYDGGFPLQAYAWTHFYYVVSASRGDHSKIIDVTGRVLASTSRWTRLVAETIDLEKEVFHIDAQTATLRCIQQERGAGVTARGFGEENVFTLESNDPEWPLSRVKAHYGLENYRDYHARAQQVQDEYRERERPLAALPAAPPKEA